MLVEPSLDDLLEKVDNKFKLVTLALKRARQINDGHPLMIDSGAAKPVSLALQEIHEGRVFVKDAPEETGETTLEDALRMVEADEAIETIEHQEEAEIEAAARDLAAAGGDEDEEDEEE